MAARFVDERKSLAGGGRFLENLAGQTLSLSGTVALLTGTSVRNFGDRGLRQRRNADLPGRVDCGAERSRRRVDHAGRVVCHLQQRRPDPRQLVHLPQRWHVAGRRQPGDNANVYSLVSFSNTGTISNLLLNFVP